jgi:adenylosuccinate lyase
VEEMRRNLHRLNEAKKIISVGKISGAVGTYATVPPQIEQVACKKLGIDPAPVSNQILQRDRHAEFITTLAIIAGSLEKFATEIRGLQRTEIHEVEEPFGQPGFVTTGSSAMPHKRNPELTERVCGIARLIRGYALTSLENIALWHERDISHSSNERITFPDACIIMDYAIALFASVVKRMLVFPDKMRKDLELTKGLVFSQRVMLGLIDKGMSRQDAYKIAQRNATKAWQGTKSFITLIRKDPDVAKTLTSGELDKIFDYDYYTQHVDEIFLRLGLTKSQWGTPDTK